MLKDDFSPISPKIKLFSISGHSNPSNLTPSTNIGLSPPGGSGAA
jgi:hypothetical protein